MSNRLIYCSSCDAQVEAGCGCGVGYISASAFAIKVLARSPEKSNRALADGTGISYKTIERARKPAGTNVPPENSANSAGTNVPPEKRVGLDGKTYSMPKAKAPPKAETPFRPATPEEWGDHKSTAERVIDERTGENISKVEAMKRQAVFEATRELEAQIVMLNAEIERLKNGALGDLRRIDAIANHTQRITTDVVTYDLFRRCLHPDSRVSVSDEMLHKAWIAFREMEPVTYDKSKIPAPLPRGLDDLFRARQEAANRRKHKL